MATHDDEHIPTVCVLFLIVAFVCMAGFGAANWSCYYTPRPPPVPANASKDQFQFQAEQHQLQLESARRGDGAVVPFVSVIPLTFGGVAGALICLCVLIHRYGS